MGKDSPPLTVRPAETTDVATLVALLRQLFAIEEDFRIDEERQRRGLAMLLENPQALILVAEAAGRVIGMCSGQLLVSTAEGGPALLMEDLVVAEGFRGCGAGRLLVSAMADWAARRGASRLQLLADRNNSRALSFYQAIGWQTTNLICLRRYQDSREGQPQDRQLH
jgi:ribosomal protein S18 acetylase RimI-like enzyme